MVLQNKLDNVVHSFRCDQFIWQFEIDAVWLTLAPLGSG